MKTDSDTFSESMRRWLLIIFPALDAALAGDDEARRRVVTGAAALLGGPMVVYLVFVGFDLGYTLVSYLGIVTAICIFAVYFAVRRGPGRWAARIGLVSVFALQLTAIATAPDQFPLVWVMLLPLLMTFFFGRLEGAVWSIGALVLYAGLLANPGLVGIDPDVEFWPAPDRIIDFVFAYLLATVLSIGYETLRHGAQVRLRELIEIQAASEARTRDFNRIGTDLLFELDHDLRITHLSGSWEELTGVAVDQVMGRHLWQNEDHYTLTGWGQSYEKLLDRQPVRDERITLQLKDGRELVIEIRLEPTTSRDGTFTGFRGVGVDVTGRIMAEQELREKDRALEQAARMEAIGQLTSGVAHDFNNLLTVIIGNLEMMQEEDGLDPVVSEHIEQVSTAARSAADLTSKLLAFSRRQSLQPERIDTAELVEDTAGLLARILPETIRVEVRPDQEVNDCLADRSQLQSAIVNLALNARDAMPEGGTLQLSASDVELNSESAAGYEVEPGRFVVLRVTDTGFGMAPETAEHIFEPFFSTKPTGRGTGLGLSMVYGFVRQTGGGVGVKSEPGKGTTIELLIPWADSQVAAAAPRSTLHDSRADGQTILVIEDEAAVRNLVVTMLSRLGYRALSAADGEEGLRLFNEFQPNAVISDVVLAGSRNGIETIAAIRELRPRVPAMFMSGYSDFSDIEGLPDGVPLLAKPFNMAQLQGRLEELLEVS